ncbi:hypothetical protein [Enterococcus sp. N249-2]
MKWEKETLMKDGTKIRIEDWSEDFSFHEPFDLVVAYPICKRTVGAFIREGESFRLELDFSNKEESEDAFNNLVKGDKIFIDYIENIDPRYRKCI